MDRMAGFAGSVTNASTSFTEDLDMLRIFAARATIPLLVTVSCSFPLRAEGPSLGSYVPANVHMYSARKSTPAVDRLTRPFENAVGKLIESGIFADLFELATAELAEGERDEIRAVIGQVTDLLGKADWKALTKREVAVGFQLASLFPEYLVLFRVPEAHAADHQDELHGILEGVAGFAPDFLDVSRHEKQGAKISTLRGDGVPISLTAASKKDVVVLVLSASDTLLDDTFALVDGTDNVDAIVDDPRFIASQEGMPGEPHGHFYFNFDAYVGVISGLVQLAASQGGDSPQINAVLAVVKTIFEEIRKLETVGLSERAEGDLSVVDSRVVFSQDGKSGFIEKLIAAQEPITADFVRVVPRDATGFWMTSGVNPLTVYDTIISGVRRLGGEEGEQLLAVWKAVQEQSDFLLRDLLSWIDGGMGVVMLPSTSGGSGEAVVYFRVTDGSKAKIFLEAVWSSTVEYVRGREQNIDRVKVEGLPDFEEIHVDAMPWFRPVVGFPEGVVVIASSAEAAKRVGAAVTGRAPNISENPRFQALGMPDGSFTEIFYSDVERSLADLADLLGSAGFFLSLVPEERDTRPVIKTGHILTKLAAFLRDVDIAVDYGSWSSYDAGKRRLETTQATKLRVPAAQP